MDALLDILTHGTTWIVIGAGLLALELALPSLIIGFFGLGAFVTAVVSWLGIVTEIGYLLLVFLISSILSLILLRRWLKPYFYGDVDEVQKPGERKVQEAGEIVKVLEDISPGSKGKVQLHGTLWEAVSSEKIPAGENVRITGRKNITLEVTTLKEE